MKLKYVGSAGSVFVPQANLVAERGETIEIEDADIAAGLLAQDSWEKVGGKTTKPDTAPDTTDEETS